MICGLEGCAAYLDDVIITGRNIEKHVAYLEALFKRISDYGFRVRIGMQFPDASTPIPRKYNRCYRTPIRSRQDRDNTHGATLHEHRPEEVSFKWSAECQDAFQRAKDVLASDLLLTHYDPTKEIVVAADASEYGIGAVISHRFSDGKEKAIHHACRSLTAAEKNYGQVRRRLSL
ncbi:hypothetical protein TELCIR_19680 [Teladorsagia circumcincta]|uniref:Reverse transcriptase/retrotransposon-derived protein RNase H-like domain-containing protein n=1 Tax=Teladorsagia circumcincta TaxID=45464 RepID=A0A2G9TLL3_TELCI|nr:hypothetical protein TELCIR_19680 [Teladorsagia circumcincta]